MAVLCLYISQIEKKNSKSNNTNLFNSSAMLFIWIILQYVDLVCNDSTSNKTFGCNCHPFVHSLLSSNTPLTVLTGSFIQVAAEKTVDLCILSSGLKWDLTNIQYSTLLKIWENTFLGVWCGIIWVEFAVSFVDAEPFFLVYCTFELFLT